MTKGEHRKEAPGAQAIRGHSKLAIAAGCVALVLALMLGGFLLSSTNQVSKSPDSHEGSQSAASAEIVSDSALAGQSEGASLHEDGAAVDEDAGLEEGDSTEWSPVEGETSSEVRSGSQSEMPELEATKSPNAGTTDSKDASNSTNAKPDKGVGEDANNNSPKHEQDSAGKTSYDDADESDDVPTELPEL